MRGHGGSKVPERGGRVASRRNPATRSRHIPATWRDAEGRLEGCFVDASNRWAGAGAWTKRISRSAATGGTCTGLWTSDGNDVPQKITIDKSGANTAAVQSMIDDSGLDIELRQSKYLNNIVEQDHRANKRRTRPMLGFKDFRSAAKIIAGIETMHSIKKGQLTCPEGQTLSASEQFYSLAF